MYVELNKGYKLAQNVNIKNTGQHVKNISYS